MQTNKNILLWTAAVILLFAVGIGAGFLYFSKQNLPAQMPETARQEAVQNSDLSFVKVYYPSKTKGEVEGRLLMEERKVERQINMVSIAEAAVGEFLKGPSTPVSSNNIPQGTKLLKVFSGSDGVIYIDLSDEFRRNFQGDASTEFLLLKGLYDTVISNIQGADDVKVIVEGREIESIGGHLSALYPLKNTLRTVQTKDER